VRMERRPERGIWGGLWSFSELPTEVDATQWWRDQEGSEPGDTIELPVIAHTFSHFHLVITPVLLKVNDPTPRVAEVDSCRWVDPRVPEGLGLPAPIARLLELLSQTEG
jgi:A/G-specific adenine glycosylase